MRALRRGSRISAAIVALVTGWVLTSPDAMAGIATTSHDFSTDAPDNSLCVACHTPHKAPDTLLLWNHTTSANANFSWSDATATTGGTTLPSNIKTWSGSTKNCLSCHDGSVDIGSIVNPTTNFDATRIAAGFQVGASGDLKGNHPVAVPYPYNQAQNTYNGATTGAVLILTDYVAAPTNVKIFSDPAAAAPNNRGIECASCHDPHGTSNPEFLRNTKANLCADCHNK